MASRIPKNGLTAIGLLLLVLSMLTLVQPIKVVSALRLDALQTLPCWFGEHILRSMYTHLSVLFCGFLAVLSLDLPYFPALHLPLFIFRCIYRCM
jgi:hypothetical protein